MVAFPVSCPPLGGLGLGVADGHVAHLQLVEGEVEVVFPPLELLVEVSVEFGVLPPNFPPLGDAVLEALLKGVIVGVAAGGNLEELGES